MVANEKVREIKNRVHLIAVKWTDPSRCNKFTRPL